ncbi:hypothetical protein D5086_010563 [Populus alba]|uniref:Uncharacterized protein n=1 Tax=Populus alba TaxID=43335 RepID=A0ACC4C9R4_POPAL
MVLISRVSLLGPPPPPVMLPVAAVNCASHCWTRKLHEKEKSPSTKPNQDEDLVATYHGRLNLMVLGLVVLSSKASRPPPSCASDFQAMWSLIAGRLPGRTDNEIKNYWNTHVRKKLLSRGIDPSTHRPINESAIDNMTTSLGAVLKEEIASGFGCKNQKNPNGEKCRDLNLELRICPPYQHPPQSMKSIGRKIMCFYCSLGLKNSKDCSCSNDSDDFLVTKNGALDYTR